MASCGNVPHEGEPPARFRLGFSIFGFELFAFTLHGEARLNSL